MSAQVILKKENYCQIKLDSGERILVSLSSSDVKVFKLGFGGLLPTKTLLSMSSIKAAIFLEENGQELKYGILEAFIKLCLTSNSINDLLTRFAR